MTIKDKRKDEIESVVRQFCDDCTVSVDDPIDVVAIARKKGFKVQRLNMDKNTTGMLLYSQDNNISGLDTNKLIAVKNGLPEEQSRLILSHELGHYSLFSNNSPLIAHRRYSHLQTNTEEQEADYFARALLMPQERIVAMIKQMRGQGFDDNKIICDIAKAFNVTENKAKIRFYELLQKVLDDEREDKE